MGDFSSDIVRDTPLLKIPPVYQGEFFIYGKGDSNLEGVETMVSTF